MIRLLEILSLLLAILTSIFAVRVHQKAPDAQARWGSRAILLLVLGSIAATAPRLFFPAASWLHWTGTFLSLGFTGASLHLLRRQFYAGVKNRARQHDVDDTIAVR